MNFNESIYSLEAKHVIQTERLPRLDWSHIFSSFTFNFPTQTNIDTNLPNKYRYKSRYRDQVLKEVRDCKSACKTMGFPYRQTKPPSSRPQLMMSGSNGDDGGNEWCNEIKCVDSQNDPGHNSAYKRSKSARSPIFDPVVCGAAAAKKSTGVTTAIDAIALPLRMPPRNASKQFIQINQLCRAGLQPIYIHKPTFGKIPIYLRQRSLEANSEEERQRSEEIRGQILCQYVPSGERTAVLEV